MEAWNGGRGSFWSGYRRETVGSNVSSSSSGTTASRLSSAYASSGSRFSIFSMEAEAAMHFDMDEAEEENIRSLVQKFFSAPSVTQSIRRGDMSVVDRWIKHLGVGWVLHLDDGPSAVKELRNDGDALRSWIPAMDQIAMALCFTRPLFPDRGSVVLAGICDKEEEHVAEEQLALLIQETMLKILAFVDFAVTWDPWAGVFDSIDLVTQPPYGKLYNQLMVQDALSEASNKIPALSDAPTSVEVQRIENEIGILLSAYKSKLGEAIRSTMDKIRTTLMEDDDDSSSPVNPQGSSDIHKVTRSAMTYIEFLIEGRLFFLRGHSRLLVNAAIKGHVPHTENISPVDRMIVEIISSLQESLASISESFSDQGLKFLFLLNNSYNIQQSLQFYYFPGPVLPAVDSTNKIEGYMERYLQVSWAPLLSCLFNPTLLCLGKNSSPLFKFESKFQKIYTTQKEWKVPDPVLRRRLRQVITDTIIPGYAEYIQDNKVNNPKISPQELKVMLQELFEG